MDLTWPLGTISSACLLGERTASDAHYAKTHPQRARAPHTSVDVYGIYVLIYWSGHILGPLGEPSELNIEMAAILEAAIGFGLNFIG